MKYKYVRRKDNINNRKNNLEDYGDNYTSPAHKNNSGYVDIYSSNNKGRKRRRFPWIKALWFTFFLALGVVGAGMLYMYKTLNSFNYDNTNPPPTTETENDSLSDSMVLNILLIGSDSMSVGDGGRSDSMILVSIDARNKKLKLTSFMRDLWVNIPGHGQDRLNASYAYGGPQLTIETINKNFGVPIDRYAVVDFEGFSKIIDILGGIDMELTADECAYINKYSKDKHTLKGSGVKHLTGLQALHYSRDRNSIGSDYDRTNRQRKVVQTVLKQMKNSNVAKITEIISAAAPLVTTNFKQEEIAKMAVKSTNYLNYPVSEFRLPTDDNVQNKTISGKMVLVTDKSKAKKDILKFIYENEPETKEEPKTSNSSNKNDSSSNSKNKTTSSTQKSASTSGKSEASGKSDKNSANTKSSATTKSKKQV